MGCNAHNHPSNCQCGWGGDTGGGYSYGHGAAASLADGFDWSRSRAATLDSYVNPNARCPVCGADVFFYRSPYDGRVFFDSLGPPWPKHPCTDTRRGSLSMGIVHRAAEPRKRMPTARGSPWDWQPLIATKVITATDFDLFYLDRSETGFSGRFIPLKSGMYHDAPKYWRRHQADPRFVEISTISRPSQDSGSMSHRWASKGTDARAQERLAFGMMTENFFAPGWMVDPDDIERTMSEIDASGSIWNATAWSLSFHWKHVETPDWASDCRVDWKLAKSLFEKAASLNYWAAANNLGVIHRDGLGQLEDPEQAFHWFTIAAESLEPISLRHLAGCYSTGFGTKQDTEHAAYLEELAETIASDQK
jgi:hypothetical protein